MVPKTVMKTSTKVSSIMRTFALLNRSRVNFCSAAEPCWRAESRSMIWL